MHFGSNTKMTKYMLNGTLLETVDEEKDLGVFVTNDFKVYKQCRTAANKGKQILGMISRSFECKNKTVMKNLYKSLVRPHLDYCIQAWRPHYKKDIDVIEKVQRRATKMVTDLKDVKYEERLKRLNLTTLETRRQRADLIEVFKIMTGKEKVKEEDFLTRSDRIGRGHSLKLYKKGTKKDVGKFSFGNRVCELWNRLPETVVMATSINVFKNGVDTFLEKNRGFK